MKRIGSSFKNINKQVDSVLLLGLMLFLRNLIFAFFEDVVILLIIGMEAVRGDRAKLLLIVQRGSRVC